jgi:tetratricopeptide (TPR) repeat protein
MVASICPLLEPHNAAAATMDPAGRRNAERFVVRRKPGNERDAGAVPPAPSRFARLGRRLWALLLRAWELGKVLVTLALRFVAWATVAVLVVVLVRELTRRQIEIQPIAVPPTMVQAGYSPEVSALRLQDAINRVADTAADAGAAKLPIYSHSEVPDIVVPQVGMSMSTVAAYLHRFFGYSPRTAITGEFTGPDRGLRLLLRLDGQVIFRSFDDVSADHPEEAFRQAAEAVMREISPYSAALAKYDTDPVVVTDAADSIVHRYPAADENVGWAHVLRGLHRYDGLQYSAAETEFREALESAAAATGLPLWLAARLPQWLPLAAPPSYTEPTLFYLGRISLDQDNADQAQGFFREAIAFENGDPGAHHYLGMALLTLNRTSEAEAEFAATRQIYDRMFAGVANPKGHGAGSAPDHVSLGNSLMAQGRTDEALAQFTWALELDPNSDEAHLAMCEGLRQARRFDAGLSECRKAVSIAPRLLQNQTGLAWALVARSLAADPRELGRTRDLEDARGAADAALWLAPDSPTVHELLASIDAMADNPNQAIAEYQTAIALAPEHAEFYLELGTTLAQQGDAAGAIREYKEAIARNPRNAMWHNALGVEYYLQGDFAAAEAAFREALRLKPDDPVMKRNLKNAIARQSQ